MVTDDFIGILLLFGPFEIRVAGLREQLRMKAPPLGMTLHELREAFGEISQRAQALVAEKYQVLNQQVLPALNQAGIRLLRGACLAGSW